MLFVCVIVFIYIAIGMKWYARVQKSLLLHGHARTSDRLRPAALRQQRKPSSPGLNANLPALYGVRSGSGLLRRHDCCRAGSRRYLRLRSASLAFVASFALIPMIVFFNLWPNWGSTLYGEVRGASDYKRNFWGMASAIIVTAGLALVFFLLINKTIGWEFYIMPTAPSGAISSMAPRSPFRSGPIRCSSLPS